jgi:hypothetical protein
MSENLQNTSLNLIGIQDSFRSVNNNINHSVSDSYGQQKQMHSFGENQTRPLVSTSQNAGLSVPGIGARVPSAPDLQQFKNKDSSAPQSLKRSYDQLPLPPPPPSALGNGGIIYHTSPMMVDPKRPRYIGIVPPSYSSSLKDHGSLPKSLPNSLLPPPRSLLDMSSFNKDQPRPLMYSSFTPTPEYYVPPVQYLPGPPQISNGTVRGLPPGYLPPSVHHHHHQHPHPLPQFHHYALPSAPQIVSSAYPQHQQLNYNQVFNPQQPLKPLNLPRPEIPQPKPIEKTAQDSQIVRPISESPSPMNGQILKVSIEHQDGNIKAAFSQSSPEKKVVSQSLSSPPSFSSHTPINLVNSNSSSQQKISSPQGINSSSQKSKINGSISTTISQNKNDEQLNLLAISNQKLSLETLMEQNSRSSHYNLLLLESKQKILEEGKIRVSCCIFELLFMSCLHTLNFFCTSQL